MINNQNIGVLSEKVARLESDVKTLALPSVTSSDEGKSPVVNASGSWEAANIRADNVILSEGVSVKDAVDTLESGVSLLSIPANTYSTWELALQALYVEYNKLTTEQKKRCSLIRSNDIIYKCTAVSGAFSSVYAGAATRTIIQSVFLESGIFLSHKLEGATIETTSQSNEPQGYSIELRMN